MQIIGAILLLFLVTACGKSNSNAGLPIQKEQAIPVNLTSAAGLYMARFQTLNPLVNGSIPGSATVKREADKFYAYVKIYGSAPHTWHQQNVYEGRRCPTMSDDKNGDGYIDIEEARLVLGNVVIPLDSNINTHALGRNVYPVSDATGTYFYERVSSVRKMTKDLINDNKSSSDTIRIDPAKGFDIEGRAVVIQGTASDVYYPATVNSNEGRPAFQTMPIACGVFSKITSIPSDIEEEENPQGPTGPTTPTTPTTPGTGSEPDTDEDSEDDSDSDDWFGRFRDWWNDRWNRDRGNRVTEWGNGEF